MIQFSPFIGRKLVLKAVSVWLCFPRQQKQNSHNKGLVPRALGAQPRRMRALFHGMECVKPVLNRTLWSLHEASQTIKLLWQMFISWSNTVFQHFEASQFSASEEMFRNMLWCFWLHLIGWFRLRHDTDVTSLSERPFDHGTLCSMPFSSGLAASINRHWVWL